MRRSISLLAAGAALVIAAVLALAAPAQAAQLSPVSGFGSNPGNLAMYAYRPDGLPSGAPAVVLLHGCSQDATGYFTNSGWRTFADRWRFALIIPQQSSSNNATSCFNFFETGDTTRGQGEAASIRSMVGYAVSNYGTAADRVYVSGLSAGGAMSAVMLATYPDVFAAGSVVAGIAYRCATSMVNAFTCMNPGVDKTPAQWGDLVRGAFPGYTGARPKVAIWHGTADYTVATANANESRDQWTNVLGISASPTSTSSLPGGTTQERYGNDQVRVYRVSGMGHGTPVDPGSAADQCGTAAAYFLDTICSAYYDATFFGLNTGGPTTPPTSAPPTTAPPTTNPPTTGPCVTATNYAHVVAGRAYQQLGYVYARGSNQAMGLYNVFQTNGLRQTGPDYWVVGC
ncbi:poly(hydroxyalkanoate) depolymerase family esterase [Asanoa ferruginea]|uniref:Poly(Hydroxyalkanoate) depolymerase family esterase n=1 Tax=Asanoa ferruginea TaxID=53367 RepID=A0A3E0A1B2_9ACTN|nr:PHB depolymerase family esterase [Asanoa ferruginea]REG02254.1 poly(hydroxyalkanoate) depolymerase family esterase [Asanoa ferruginea]GIF46491.1 feruloyl esterase [Asanoa ferruginea]